MESMTVGAYLDALRAQRGWTWREVCQKATVSNGTLAKIRENGSDGAKREYVARVEQALKIPPGTIERLTRGEPIPDHTLETPIERGPSPNLKLGEVLYAEETDDGIKYRLEVAPGYGAVYIWSAPQKTSRVAHVLRAMTKVVKEVGELIE